MWQLIAIYSCLAQEDVAKMGRGTNQASFYFWEWYGIIISEIMDFNKTPQMLVLVFLLYLP